MDTYEVEYASGKDVMCLCAPGWMRERGQESWARERGKQGKEGPGGGKCGEEGKQAGGIKRDGRGRRMNTIVVMNMKKLMPCFA